ncbi:isopentenyl phosphate kinase [Methanosphaerula palustris]|uniref:Isopentenyl phosphate kinase n=1 Tax=Methanosphaerula palustris (strain ATCC BAA-1556 / DSM 19958 / E1-9c) TaxID=521011 RepID=B8GEF5_METPE|nr:isopentenyl phosphate kinase [Methanosphaerula palustris]ACL17656.1 aspartate/glutamate/uridylate kinase [Methanosphaerula palustris E1-9c]
MHNQVMLKLGGSVITDKAGKDVIDRQQLATIASTLKESAFSGYIVHGAGSCGHPEAHQYHLDLGADRSNAVGIGVTHRAVTALNRAVVEALQNEGIDAIGVHLLDSCLADDGRLVSAPVELLDRLNALGITPVLHGDVVLDRRRGACIVSGDQVISALSPQLAVGRVGLATDVPGVLSSEGQVVRSITPSDIEGLSIGTSSSVDVTGGMQGKIRELLVLAGGGVESHIFAVSRLQDFLHQRDHGGTVVRMA